MSVLCLFAVKILKNIIMSCHPIFYAYKPKFKFLTLNFKLTLGFFYGSLNLDSLMQCTEMKKKTWRMLLAVQSILMANADDICEIKYDGLMQII
uniref:Uncharacterized protein n=1 Tax=Oryza brachyantha TaxID=4533 RepID=J3MGH4_ORYBR